MSHAGRDLRGQRGASLVEIMIALVLGMLLTAALFQVYVSSKQSYRLQEALIRRQENLRYATLALTRDLRMAGYRGCLSEGAQIRNTLNGADEYLYNYGLPAQGFEAVDGGWSPPLHSSVGAVVPGTDVLTLRMPLDPVVYVARSMPEASADLKVQEGLDPPPFAPAGGDIVLISDCSGAAVFQITQYTAASGNIVHNTGSAKVAPGNATKDLGRRYPAGSEIMKIVTAHYFIRDSAAGTGPALWKRVGPAQPGEELVEGIENLQLLYGEDSDGDWAPDAYRKANEVTDWSRVVAVRVALLAVGVGETLAESDPRTFRLLDTVVGPFNDRRLRRVITFTVTLRSRLP